MNSEVQSREEFNAAVGRLLRVERKLAGLTQHQLGEQLKVTFQQIQKYESGKDGLSAYRLVRISEILGIKPEKLLTGNFIIVGAANG